MNAWADGGDAGVPEEVAGRSRAEVLAALQAAGEALPVSAVAARVGLHTNTARFHLEHLIREGAVQRENERRSTPGRPRALYRALHPASTGRRSYRLLAEVLAGSLVAQVPHPAQVAKAAGRTWGRSLIGAEASRPRPGAAAATEDLVEVLADVGFAPEAVTVGRRRRILLHHCPFLEAARRNPEVVCAVHLGLMEGVLAQLRAPVVTDRLEPFVTPELCVAHLASLRRGRKAAGSGRVGAVSG